MSTWCCAARWCYCHPASPAPAPPDRLLLCACDLLRQLMFDGVSMYTEVHLGTCAATTADTCIVGRTSMSMREDTQACQWTSGGLRALR